MDILEKIKEILRERLGVTDQAFLYGSQARGTANAESDWDILIILDKDKVRTEDYDNVSYPLTYLGWVVDQIISPILYTKKEWNDQRFSPFFCQCQTRCNKTDMSLTEV